MAELWTVNRVTNVRLLMALLAATVVVRLVHANAFEAAFQGECREDSPCQHSCFDLHDGTFECSCKEGYTLHINGYSCTENAKILKEEEISDKDTSSWPFYNDTLADDSFAADAENQVQPLTENPIVSEQGELPNETRHEEIEFNVHKGSKDSVIKKPVAYKLNGSQGRSSSFLYDKGAETTVKPVLTVDGSEPMNTVFVSTPSVHPRFSSCGDLQCEFGGVCVPDLTTQDNVRCRCPLGRRGKYCEQSFEIRYPRFQDGSYLILPVLRDAHKSMQVTMEFRPEANDGLLLYSGEKIDLQEDFISITLNKGFIEFRFDCGMGEGLLTSDQPVLLHSWNSLTIYRDRWDAWMQLNSGSQVQGRSKGLFSRITFHLNLYVGGSPNITLVSGRTSSNNSFRGCLRHLAINREVYDFRSGKMGDILDGVDIENQCPKFHVKSNNWNNPF